MIDRFKLEEQIMNCWNVVEDIQTVIDGVDLYNEDQLMNVLIGVKELYNIKFVKLFDTYEDLVKNGDLK